MAETPERLSSRKFMSFVSIFISSCIFGWFKAESMGDLQMLFNFWLMLLGIYLGANIGETAVKKKNI